MSSRFQSLVRAAKRLFDRISRRVKHRLGLFDPAVVMTFRTWGTSRHLTVQGRVIERKGVGRPRPESGLLQNAARTVRRLESDEIPGARLEISFRGERQLVTTGREGFFRAPIEPDVPLDGGWHDVSVRLIESIAGSGQKVTASVCVPHPESEYVVISDLDDTVLVTDVTNWARMIARVAARNARTRSSFAGVPAFYRALHRGTSGVGNSIFYVSRAGWNFYDLIAEFLELHDIPAGPILLRDLAVVEPHAEALPEDEQKVAKISEVIDALGEMKFILMGDSGEADPQIYAECVETYGSRIAAVYIRRIGGRDVAPEVMELIRSRAVALCVADSTAEMARDAAARGFISAAGLREVLAESE